MIAAIVAMAHKNVIGKKNDLPWYLSADLKRFKQLTAGHVVIMGRNTADSIIARLGHGLPGRENIVITRDTTYQPEGFTAVHSLDEALALANGKTTYVIGGEQIFRLALPVLDRLYITEVDAAIDGDTFFPEIDASVWRETEREQHQKDDKNDYNYTFVTLEKIVAATPSAK